MTDFRKFPRRRFSAEFKAQVLAECAGPDASVARVALSHGINANVVHKWRRLARPVEPACTVPAFVPLPMPAAMSPAGEIHIELRRGAVQLVVHWPLDGAAALAQWTRELLR